MSTARNNAYPDLATMMAISTELANSVENVLGNLPSYFNSVSEEPASAALLAIHSILGFIGLRAAEMAAHTAVELARELESAGLTPSEPQRTALAAVLRGLHDYLQAAAGGHIKSGTALFDARASAAACVPSVVPVTRPEMFLPVWPLHHGEPQGASQDYEDSVRPYRLELQAAFAKFRTAPDHDGLLGLRGPLVTIETKNPPVQLRHLASLAIAYLDASAEGDLETIAQGTDITNVVDLLCQGALAPLSVPDTLVSSLLFVVAQQPDASERTRHFSQVYDLDRLTMTSVVSNEHLASAVQTGTNAKHVWEQVTSDLSRIEGLQSASIALVKTASLLDNPILRTLTVSFATLADGIASGTLPDIGVPAVVDGVATGITAMRHDVAIFGASLLLVITKQIGLLGTGRTVDRQLVDHYKQSVRSVLSGSVPTRNDAHNPSDLVFPELMEVAADTLRALEATIDLAFSDDDVETHLKTIDRGFAQIRSALEFMQIDRAAKATGSVQQLVDKTIKGEDDAERDANKSRLGGAVMRLNAYLDIAAIDLRHAESQLVALEALLDDGPDAPDQPKESVANEFDVCSEPDLALIFLAEAQSLLSETISPGLQTLRVNPSDRNVLIDVRRGFHTLKGSARMVGLINLGKLAEGVEYALNAIRDNREAKLNTTMLDWIGAAAEAFAAALGPIQEGRPAPLDPRPFTSVSERFRAGATSENVVAPTSATPVAVDLQPWLETSRVDASDGEVATTQHDTSLPTVKQPGVEPLAPIAASGIDHNQPGYDGGAEPSRADEELLSAVDTLASETSAPTASQHGPTPVVDFANMSLAAHGDRFETVAGPATVAGKSTLVVVEHTPDLTTTLALEPAGASLETDHPSHDEARARDPESSLPEVEMAPSGRPGFDTFGSSPLAIHVSEPAVPEHERDEPATRPSAEPAIASLVEDAGITADDLLPEQPTNTPGDNTLLELPMSSEPVDAVSSEATGPQSIPSAGPTQSAPLDVQDILIGSVLISRDLHETLVEEATAYVAQMNEKMTALVEGRTRRIDFEFYRMAHSLAGMGRTTGFPALTNVAVALEDWSELNQNHDILVSRTSATMLTDAMRHLTWAVDSIANAIEPSEDPWVVDNLRRLISMNEQFVVAAPAEEPARPPRQQAKPEATRAAAAETRPRRVDQSPMKSADKSRSTQVGAAPAQGRAAAGTVRNASRTAQPPAPASRKYKKAPPKPNTLVGAIIQMLARAFRAAWQKMRG